MVSLRLYHATDVKELHEWMDQACEEHPLFVRVLALKMRHSCGFTSQMSEEMSIIIYE